jgi:hypothetical protein
MSSASRTRRTRAAYPTKRRVLPEENGSSPPPSLVTIVGIVDPLSGVPNDRMATFVRKRQELGCEFRYRLQVRRDRLEADEDVRVDEELQSRSIPRIYFCGAKDSS